MVHRHSIVVASAVIAARASASSALASEPLARVVVAGRAVSAHYLVNEYAEPNGFEDRALALGFARMPFDEAYDGEFGPSESDRASMSVSVNARQVSTLALAPTPGAVGLTVLIGCLTARRPRRA